MIINGTTVVVQLDRSWLGSESMRSTLEDPVADEESPFGRPSAIFMMIDEI